MEDIFLHLHQHYLINNEMTQFFFTCRAHYALFSKIKVHAPMPIEDYLAFEKNRQRHHVIIEHAIENYDLRKLCLHTLTQIVTAHYHVMLNTLRRLNYIHLRSIEPPRTYFHRAFTPKFDLKQCEILHLCICDPVQINFTHRSMYLHDCAQIFYLQINRSCKSLNIIAPEICMLNFKSFKITHLRLKCQVNVDMNEILNIRTLKYVCILHDSINHIEVEHIALPFQLQHFIHDGSFKNIRYHADLKSLHVWRCHTLIGAPSDQYVIHHDKTRAEFVNHFKF